MGQVSSSTPPNLPQIKLDNPGLPLPIPTFGWRTVPPNLVQISESISALKAGTFAFSTKHPNQHPNFFTILTTTHHVIPWEGTFSFLATLSALIISVRESCLQICANEASLVSMETDKRKFTSSGQNLGQSLTELEACLEILQDPLAPAHELVEEISFAVKALQDIWRYFEPDSFFARNYHISGQLLPPLGQLCGGILLIVRNTLVDGKRYEGSQLEDLQQKYGQGVHSLRLKCIAERLRSCRIKVRMTNQRDKVTYDFVGELGTQFPQYFGDEASKPGQDASTLRLERSLKYQKLEGSAEVDVEDGWDSRKFSEISFTPFSIQGRDSAENRKMRLYPEALRWYRGKVVEVMEEYFKGFL